MESDSEIESVEVVLFDGTRVPNLRLTQTELRTLFKDTFLGSAFESDTTAHEIVIPRESMSVATVQRFVQNQRNLFTQNERFSLSELHDMRYLGGQTSLFAAPGVHEHPDVLEIAVSIIEFERTLRECTSTDIEMIDMYLLALLFRFVNEMLNLMPLEEQTAAFQRLYETLTEFSECCRSQAAELKRLKYDVFCLDNAVSRCSVSLQYSIVTALMYRRTVLLVYSVCIVGAAADAGA
ncbi:MAG: hypothetical protein MHM6MM_003870 [Cercozoa sp. M6MM]